MAVSDLYEILLDRLQSSRRQIVERLVAETAPSQQQFGNLADLQQAIMAVEAVVAESKAASGGMPLTTA